MIKIDLREQPLSRRLPEYIFNRIHQDIGQASMCWDSPDKAGIFHADDASTIAFNLCHFVADELDKVRSGSNNGMNTDQKQRGENSEAN